MSSISVNGDMYGDIVQGDQHKGDVVQGDKSQGQTNIAGDMSGNITQTFTVEDAQQAQTIISAVCAKITEVLQAESPQDVEGFSQVAGELQTAAASPPEAVASTPTTFDNVKAFFGRIAPTVAKAALKGGITVLSGLAAKNPLAVVLGLQAVLTELYESHGGDA